VIGNACSSPLISVAIPTRDRAELLEQCLGSFAGQTLARNEFEVIVVDDGSTDETAQVCERVASSLPMCYQRLAPSGIAAAKNAGLFASSGQNILFFDDDDMAHPRLLEAHVRAHREWSEPRIAILGYTTWLPSLEVTPLMRYVTEIGQHLFSYPSLEAEKELDFTRFWGGRSSAKRAFLLEHGAFNQDFTFGYEDIELAFRLSKHGFAVVYRADAISYMTRPLNFKEFCQRCERQGRSLWHFSQLHTARAVQEYCGINTLVTAAEVPSFDLDASCALEIARLEELANGELDTDLTCGLYDLYETSFRAALETGIVAARGDDEALAFAPTPSDPSIALSTLSESSLPLQQTTPPPVSSPRRIAALGAEACQKPVFVVGSPRSGTSALAWALNEHTHLQTSSESDFLYYLFAEDSRLYEVWKSCLARPNDTYLVRERVRWDELLASLGYGINRLFTARAGGRRWVDQTPLYTVMIDLLLYMFPDSQFVHILRDGRRVVTSMAHFAKTAANPQDLDTLVKISRYPGWAGSFRAACQTWSSYSATALNFEGQFPDRVITVRNEALLERPADGFRELLTFLGLGHEPGPAEFFASYRLNSSFGPDYSPPPSLAQRPWDEWSEEWQEIFHEEAGEMMIRAGYSENFPANAPLDTRVGRQEHESAVLEGSDAVY
jgi:hypothetical protein